MKSIKLSLIFLSLSTLFWISCEHPDDPIINVVADAGEDQAISLGSKAYLDGSGSTNALNQEMSFKWELLKKPEGSSYAITTADVPKIEVSPDVVGEYLFNLRVDYQSHLAFDQVKVTVTEHAGAVLISEDITAARILEDVFPDHPDLLDYIVTQEVDVEALLEVRPQVRIGFEAGAKLTIKSTGALKAESLLPTEPIIFQGKEASKGHWQGIQIESSSEKNSLRGAIVRDSGKAPLGTAIMVVEKAALKMSETKVANNDGVATTFMPTAILGDFMANTFEDNTGGALRISARLVSQLPVTNRISGGNIQVTEGEIRDGQEHVWPKFESAYDILEDLVISEKSQWVITAGTQINMADDKLIRVINQSKIILLGEQATPVKIEGITKAKGSWRGIYMDNSGQEANQITFAEIRHAGSATMAGKEPASVQLGRKGKLAISHSLLDLGLGNGLEAISDESELNFEGNTISNHHGHPIVVATDLVEKLDFNTAFDNNGKPEVKVEGNKPIAKATETVWKGFFNQIPYLIDGLGKDLRIYSGLRLEAGVTIKFMPNSLMLVQDAQGYHGYLKIAGSAGLPVVIKGKEETAGSWYGVTISSERENTIDHAIILHGGKPMQNNFSANISLDNSPVGRLTIRNSTIGKSGQHGIAVAKQLTSNLIHGGLTFSGNAGDNIHIWGN
jgi:hypothetical protein